MEYVHADQQCHGNNETLSRIIKLTGADGAGKMDKRFVVAGDFILLRSILTFPTSSISALLA